MIAMIDVIATVKSMCLYYATEQNGIARECKVRGTPHLFYVFSWYWEDHWNFFAHMWDKWGMYLEMMSPSLERWASEYLTNNSLPVPIIYKNNPFTFILPQWATK